MMNVLITGGCGFIGSNLVFHLAKSRNYRITVLDNESSGKREFLDGARVEFIPGDIRDLALVKRATKKCDVIVHLAAKTEVIASIQDPWSNFDVNVVGTLNLLRAIRGTSCRRFINASTGGAIVGESDSPVHESMCPMPINPYGASKLAAEGYCFALTETDGIRPVSLRFSNVYGPISWHQSSVISQFLKNILGARRLVVYGDGSQTRDYLYVGDLCITIESCMNNEVKGVFQLGTGVPTSVNELLAIIRSAIGNEFKLDVDYEQFRKGEIRNNCSDISKARRELQYDPTTDLRTGVSETWQWFKRLSRLDE